MPGISFSIKSGSQYLAGKNGQSRDTVNDGYKIKSKIKTTQHQKLKGWTTLLPQKKTNKQKQPHTHMGVNPGFREWPTSYKTPVVLVI